MAYVSVGQGPLVQDVPEYIREKQRQARAAAEEAAQEAAAAEAEKAKGLRTLLIVGAVAVVGVGAVVLLKRKKG